MAYLNSRPRTPEICPVCGESVPPRALACPECGADHLSGWKEDANLDGLSLPDDDFNYEEFVKEEFENEIAPRGFSPLWWITAILLLLALVALGFSGVF